MSNTLNVLIIQTYGIDISYKIEDSLLLSGCAVTVCNSASDAFRHLSQTTYNAILVNLEPDGKGGISGLEFLHQIVNSARQKNSVCFGVSAQPGISLLTTHPEYIDELAILVGWLIVPMNTEKATQLIIDSAQFNERLCVKVRARKTKSTNRRAANN